MYNKCTEQVMHGINNANCKSACETVQEHTLQFENNSGPDQTYWRAYYVESALGNNTHVQLLNSK